MEIPAFYIPEWFLVMVLTALYLRLVFSALDIYYSHKRRKLEWQLEIIRQIKKELKYES